MAVTRLVRFGHCYEGEQDRTGHTREKNGPRTNALDESRVISPEQRTFWHWAGSLFYLTLTYPEKPHFLLRTFPSPNCSSFLLFIYHATAFSLLPYTRTHTHCLSLSLVLFHPSTLLPTLFLTEQKRPFQPERRLAKKRRSQWL